MLQLSYSFFRILLTNYLKGAFLNYLCKTERFSCSPGILDLICSCHCYLTHCIFLSFFKQTIRSTKTKFYAVLHRGHSNSCWMNKKQWRNSNLLQSWCYVPSVSGRIWLWSSWQIYSCQLMLTKGNLSQFNFYYKTVTFVRYSNFWDCLPDSNEGVLEGRGRFHIMRQTPLINKNLPIFEVKYFIISKII